MADYTVHQSVVLNAEPSAVWDALTNPEKTRKYFFNCKVISNWKTGSSITFKGRMFFIFPFEMHGKIIKAEPGKLLKYSLTNGKGASASTSTVTDELTYKNGKTTLSITDDVGDGEGAAKRYHRSVKGWNKILDGLKKFINSE